LGDTIAVNVTAAYQEDKDKEVEMTIADGKTRTFTESSNDYPHGISQVVVPLMDSKNMTIGAVIVSVDQISN
jgi:hypothetical protein